MKYIRLNTGTADVFVFDPMREDFIHWLANGKLLVDVAHTPWNGGRPCIPKVGTYEIYVNWRARSVNSKNKLAKGSCF